MVAKIARSVMCEAIVPRLLTPIPAAATAGSTPLRRRYRKFVAMPPTFAGVNV